MPIRLALLLAALVACSAPVAAPAERTPSPEPAPTVTAVAASSVPTPTHRFVELFQMDLMPAAIAASDSQVFVAETAYGARFSDSLSRILVVPPTGGAPALVAGSETSKGVSIGGLAIRDGALYVTHGGMRDLRLDGVFRLVSSTATPVAGGPGAPTSLNSGNGDGGPALAAALQGPRSIAFASTGDLFIAESGDSRIRVVRGQTITTHAGGNGCLGAAVSPSGSAMTAAICVPTYVATDRDGALYVASERAKWIVRIDASGTLTTVSNDFPVVGLAIDRTGDLLAGDDAGRVLRFPQGRSARPVVVASDLGPLGARP